MIRPTPDMLRRLFVGWSWWQATLVLIAALLHAWFIADFYFLTDDAYISFRYAKNLALGRGLVWNAGEYVEGYTNFLWTVLLAGGIFLGLDPQKLASVLSIAASFATLFLVYRTARVWLDKSLGRSMAALVGLTAILLLSVNRSYNVWATSGLETRLFTLLLALSLLAFFRRRFLASGLWMALATMTRPDGLLFSVLMGAILFCGEWVYSSGTASRRLQRAIRVALKYAIPLALIVGAYLLFRYAYYGQWLPNTYYAKVDLPWPRMGALYLWAFLLEYGFWLILPGSLTYLLVKKQNLRPYLTLALLFLPQIFYYCYKVGGDHFEWRILDPVLPFLLLTCAHALVVFLFQLQVKARKGEKLATLSQTPGEEADYLFEEEVGKLKIVLKPGRTALRITFALWLFVLYSFLPLWPYYSSARMLGETGVPDGKTSTITGPWRLLPLIERQLDYWRNALGQSTIHLVAIRMELHRNFWRERYEQFAAMEGLTWPEGSITEDGGIGILGYFVDIPVIDRLGLTDKTVAATPRHGLEERRMMAHARTPPPGYMERREVKFYPICLVQGLHTTMKEIQADCPQAPRFAGSTGGYVGRMDDHFVFFTLFTPSALPWAQSAFSELVFAEP